MFQYYGQSTNLDPYGHLPVLISSFHMALVLLFVLSLRPVVPYFVSSALSVTLFVLSLTTTLLQGSSQLAKS